MSRIFILLNLLCPSFLWAQQPKLILPIGHTMGLNSATLSPDGKKIVTASFDRTVIIWDAITGNYLIKLNGHTKSVVSAKFSPDGKQIVSASDDSTAKIWDILDGHLVFTLKGHNNTVTDAEFSPDGTKVITASLDSSAKIWDVYTGNSLATFLGHKGGIIKAQFSPEGKKLFTSSLLDSTVKIWDIASGRLLLDIKTPSMRISGAQLNSKGNEFLVACEDSSAKIWDAQNGRLLANLKEKSKIYFANFSPDGTEVVTGISGFVSVWDASTGKLTSTIKTSDKNIPVVNGQFSPNGQKLVTVLSGGAAKIWLLPKKSLLAELTGQKTDIKSLQFSSDGKKLCTTSNDRSAKLWDTESGRLLVNLQGNTGRVNSIQYSPDGAKMILRTEGHNVVVWDVVYGKPLFELEGESNTFLGKFSPDGKLLITSTWNNTVKTWDALTGKLLVIFKGNAREVNSIEFSPDGKKVVTASFDNTAKVWDITNGNLLLNLTQHTDFVYDAYFSPDGKWISTASADGTAKIWNAATGDLMVNLTGHLNFVYSAKFSPDSKKLLTFSLDKTAIIWDVPTGKQLKTLKTSEGIYNAEFLENENKILIHTWGGTVEIRNASDGNLLYSLNSGIVGSATISSNQNKIITVTNLNKDFLSDAGIDKVQSWSADNGKFIKQISDTIDRILTLQIRPDGKNIAVGSLDNTVKIFDTNAGSYLYTFFPIEKLDYFIQIPTKEYYCTPNAAKLLHYVTRDLRVITFEQLDVRYNRPDKVLEAIGNSDTALIKSYRKAWEKRIKKLGIDTSAFTDGYSIPEANFVDRDNIDPEQKTNILSLHLKGMDSIYQLDRFNIWINEVPIFGKRGKSIRRNNSNSFDTTVIVTLSQGENRIETSVTNVNGTESYRMPLIVKYSPEKPTKEKTYFIGIGIDRFENDKYNLQFSSKDIRDLSLKLKDKFVGNIVIDTLFNENVTHRNVIALKNKIQKTTINDKVIIAYSGHGLLSKDYDYYLSTYSVNFENPEINGLPYDELENLLDSIPARKKLMLIDACHSGEVDKEEGIAMNKTADSMGLSKGVIIPESQKQNLGLKNSFELMQSLFVNVGKSTGATIISAAAGNQFALERQDLRNGVFTYSILEAMKKYPEMKISKLKTIIGERVLELTNGMQKPTSRNEAIAIDWNVW